jgi:hypothetical protein
MRERRCDPVTAAVEMIDSAGPDEHVAASCRSTDRRAGPA